MVDWAMLAALAFVTASAAIVAAKEPTPEPVTSLVSVIVWSPVFVPARFSSTLASATVRSFGSAGAPVSLPLIVLAGMFAALAFVIASFATVAAKEPVP